MSALCDDSHSSQMSYDLSTDMFFFFFFKTFNVILFYKNSRTVVYLSNLTFSIIGDMYGTSKFQV